MKSSNRHLVMSWEIAEADSPTLPLPGGGGTGLEDSH